MSGKPFPSRGKKRAENRIQSKIRSIVPALTIKLKPGLYTKLREGAMAKDVSLTVWCKAIFMEFTSIHPDLTKEDAEHIRSAVRGY